MKAKELMIGDWVCVTKNFTQKYHKIRALSNDEGSVLRGIYVNEYGVKNHSIFSPNDTEPIPLTPEILEKNGFENIGDDTYQLEEKPCWFWVDFFNHQYGCEYDTSTHEYEDDEHRLKLYGIPSVHELQHALRLCGIEKEIEL